MKCQTGSVFMYLNKLCVHVWALLSMYYSECKSVRTCVYVCIYPSICASACVCVSATCYASERTPVYLCTFFYSSDCVCVLRMCVYLSISLSVWECYGVCVCVSKSVYLCVCTWIIGALAHDPRHSTSLSVNMPSAVVSPS
jgi:hypothetical protein